MVRIRSAAIGTVVGALVAAAGTLVVLAAPSHHDPTASEQPRYGPNTISSPNQPVPSAPYGSLPGKPTVLPSAQKAPTPRPASSERPKVESKPALPIEVVVKLADGTELLDAPVDAMMAPTKPDGSWGKVEPPTWNRAVWIEQTAAPAPHTMQVSAIYGHACNVHQDCSFSAISNIRPYVPRPISQLYGATISIKLSSGRTLTYAVGYDTNHVVDLSKDGQTSLNSVSRNTPNRVRLVTCAYADTSGYSPDNRILTGTLVQ